MATNFPTSLDTLTNPNGTDKVDVVLHSEQHANANDAIEALEAKVGADSSAVTTSHDYKLQNVTGSDKAASVTGTETLTNKTLTTPVLDTPDINTPDIDGGSHDDATFANPTLTGTVQVDLGSDATGDVFYRDASGNFVRLPVGSDSQVLTLASGLPTWQALPASSGVRARATKSANQSIAASTTAQLTFDTETFDTGSDFASNTFTAPATGYYHVMLKVNVDSSGNDFNAYIYKNGAAVSVAYSDMNGQDQTIMLSDVLSLSASDTLTFYARNTGSTNATTYNVLGGANETSVSIIQL